MTKTSAWLLLLVQSACGGHAPGDGGVGGASASASTSTSTSTSSVSPTKLEQLLAALEADRDAALLEQSETDGWPAEVEGGWLFVSDDVTRTRLAGEHNAWQPEPMIVERDFAWLVVKVRRGSRYKFSDGSQDWRADRWSRAYTSDSFGEMSLVHPDTGGHVERFFHVSDGNVAPRTVRVWRSVQPASRVLYVHDGQNLFYEGGAFGSWQLEQSAPATMMIVGIDNTSARIDEYTHVPDDLGMGSVGGEGDAYAEFVDHTVRALVKKHYGEPALVGTMGSSLGGLISLLIADRFAGNYQFAASLSGTLGWGSIGPSVHNPTMIERYAAHGHQSTVLYLDSGGGGTSCADDDGDGVDDDDRGATDNYCETAQLAQVLLGLGYQAGIDLSYWHEPDAPHNEVAWAARAFRPLALFDGLK